MIGATARKRPRNVPGVAIETLVEPTTQVKDPTVRRALQSVQRTAQQLAAPANKAAQHPTLRDQVVEIVLGNGTNLVNHSLGRVPRFVYVALVEASVPASFRWSWKRGSGDADMTRIDIEVASSAPARALVRVE